MSEELKAQLKSEIKEILVDVNLETTSTKEVMEPDSLFFLSNFCSIGPVVATEKDWSWSREPKGGG